MPSDTFVGVVVVTLLVMGVSTIGGRVGVGVIHHCLYVLVVTSNETLSPKTNGEVGVTLTDCLLCTSASQTVSGFSEVSHISKISFVERTCWILVVDQKGHVWFCRFLETTDFCVHSIA